MKKQTTSTASPETAVAPLSLHLHKAMVDELRKPGYKSKEAALRSLSPSARNKNMSGLRSLVFVTKAKYDLMLSKVKGFKDRTGVVVVDEAIAKRFPTGVPGFPNKLRREWFDAAWAEAKGK